VEAGDVGEVIEVLDFEKEDPIYYNILKKLC
jgi:hypothetical protein